MFLIEEKYNHSAHDFQETPKDAQVMNSNNIDTMTKMFTAGTLPIYY